MAAVGEFFSFCNDLIAGSPAKADEDAVPSIIRSSNVQEAIVANGGAYPPDMSVLVKARKGGADYI